MRLYWRAVSKTAKAIARTAGADSADPSLGQGIGGRARPLGLGRSQPRGSSRVWADLSLPPSPALGSGIESPVLPVL